MDINVTEIVTQLQKLAETQNSSLVGIENQLKNIGTNLEAISAHQINDSFLNSQLFAAIIGAASALVVLFIKYSVDYFTKRNARLMKFYNWIAEQSVFYAPDALFTEADHTQYPTPKEAGEKMQIHLRESIKYWHYPNGTLTRLFAKYEKTISQVNQNNKIETLKDAQIIWDKIVNLSYKKTGESKWTS